MFTFTSFVDDHQGICFYTQERCGVDIYGRGAMRWQNNRNSLKTDNV